jgi:hypothetical protein
MTSYKVSIDFWSIGYTFHAFYGPFPFLSSRELLATIPEARMTHFVTVTVPPPRTDHSLRHITTRVGLQARRFRILWLRENVRFGPFSWASTRFSAPGSIFSKPPGLLTNPFRCYLMRFPLIFGYRVHVLCLLRAASLPFQPIIICNHSWNDPEFSVRKTRVPVPLR